MSERIVFPSLLGNERIKSIIGNDIAAGKNVHAYIIEGAKGTGKHTAALNIAASVVCEHRHDSSFPLPCGTCPSCRKIFGNGSVDVSTLERDPKKVTIGVDEVRDFLSNLYYMPNDGDYKIYIISEAHRLTVQAQNSLLLSLEDPPDYAVFMLLAEDSGLLLPTIRSRAPTVKTERFGVETIEEYVRNHNKKADENRVLEAARLADGSIGAAMELYAHGDNILKLYESASRLADCLIGSVPRSEGCLFISSSIPKERNDVRTMLRLTRLALRDMTAARFGAAPLFYSADTIPAAAKRQSVIKLNALDKRLSEADSDIEANCSVQTVMTELIINR